jgi:type II secretory pathway pseudopilin PulG
MLALRHYRRVQPRRPRTGVTLIELLVVIGVMLLLLVTVAPNLAPTPDQKGREAAATVISMINRAQKRAVDQEADAGLWLEPVVTSTAVIIQRVQSKSVAQLDGDNVAMATLDMFACEPQESYNGDDPEAARAFLYPVNEAGSIFVPGFRADERLVLFELDSCAFIRDLCSQSSRIKIGTGSSYSFRLLTAAEQQTLTTRYFPKPYRECNLAPGGGWLPDDHPRWENPSPPPGQTSHFYPGFGLDGTLPGGSGGPAPLLVVGWIRSDNGLSPISSGPPWWDFSPGPNATFPVSQGEVFAIQRPNTRTATPPLSIPVGYAIDVGWSTYGTVLLHNSVDGNRPGNQAASGEGSAMQLIDNFLANQPVQVMFDSSGALKHLVVRRFVAGFGVGNGAVIDSTLALNADLLLLVGRADRVGRPYVAAPTEAEPGANWQYPDSRWIKISRTTGKTLIADPCLRIDNVGVNNVYDSQSYARGDIAAVRN